jgi:hypothetical protein
MTVTPVTATSFAKTERPPARRTAYREKKKKPVAANYRVRGEIMTRLGVGRKQHRIVGGYFFGAIRLRALAFVTRRDNRTARALLPAIASRAHDN